MSADKFYKIVRFQAENIKKLTVVSISPDGAVVQITGKNGQGKTSVLDALWWAIEGATHIQVEPIRKGADRAMIKLDLGEIIVTRKFARKEDGGFTTSVVVENADGARFPSPQTILDDLYGKLTFDPLEFSRMKPAEQFDALKGFVTGFDFSMHKAKRDGDFARRADLNRQAKAAEAAASLITVPDYASAAAINVDGLVDEMAAASAKNMETQKRAERRAEVEAEIARRDAEIAREIERRDAELEAINEKIEKLRLFNDGDKKKLQTADPLPDLISIDGIRTKIEEAKKLNAAFDLKSRKSAGLAEAAKFMAEADKITERLALLEKEKRDAIAAAKLPIDGIGFGDGAVLYNGLPFEQASDAERLRVSMSIAMATNPKLRVIRVRDGSLLDADAMKAIAAMAEDRGYQVWIETVQSSDKTAIVMENGHVKDAPAAQ